MNFRDAHGSTGQIKAGAFVPYASQEEADQAVVSGSPDQGSAALKAANQKYLELQNKHATLSAQYTSLEEALKTDTQAQQITDLQSQVADLSGKLQNAEGKLERLPAALKDAGLDGKAAKAVLKALEPQQG